MRRACVRSRASHAQTRSGDKAELPEVPEDSPAWAAATSTRENCLGAKCASFGKCFVMKARRDALLADVVVVNHHLFFADVVLRDEGLAELLPACNTVILDEAHQLPAIATAFFGETVSTGQVLDLCRDALAESHVEARDVPRAAGSLVRQTDRAARDLRLALGLKETRVPAGAIEGDSEFDAALTGLQKALAKLARALAATRGARRRPRELAARRAVELDGAVRSLGGRTRDVARALGRGLYALAALHMTPLDLAEPFRRHFRGFAARVDLHLRHARCARRLQSLPTAARARASRYSELGKSFRLCRERTVLCAARTAATEQARAHGCGRRRRLAGAASERRARVFALYDLTRDAPRACALARCAPWPARPAARAGRGIAQRAARTLSPARQRRAGRKRLVLGGRRRARGGSFRRRDRQAAVCAARRSSARGAARPSAEARPQPVRRISTAAGRDRAQAGRGSPDPRRDRPRRADAVRPACAGKAVRSYACSTACRRCAGLASSPTCRRSSRAQPTKLESQASGENGGERHESSHHRRGRVHRLQTSAQAAGARDAHAAPTASRPRSAQIKLFDAAFPPDPDPRLVCVTGDIADPRERSRSARRGHVRRSSISPRS